MRSETHIRVILLTLALVAPIDAASAAEIKLRGECVPAGPVVRLGDVATVVASDRDEALKLEATELCPAPTAGDKLTLTAREICDRLELKRVDLSRHTIGGANRVSVFSLTGERPAAAPRTRVTESQRLQAQKRIRAVVLEYLRQFADVTDAWQATVELSDEQVRWIQQSGKPTVRGGSEPWTGAQQFTFLLATTNEQHELQLEVDVQSAAPIVMTNRAIGRGVILSRADLRLEIPSQPGDADGALTNIDDAVGRETVRSLGADKPVLAEGLRSQLLVHAREAITVYVRSPGIRIRTTGRAVNDGAMGELITVETIKERKTYFARVCGPQEAEVFAAGNEARPNVDGAQAAKVVTVARKGK